MPDILVSASNNIVLTQGLGVSTFNGPAIYGSVLGADLYFGAVLHGIMWTNQTDDVKKRALVSSANIINNLNLITTTHPNIERAAYEIALSLVSGVDPATEREQIYTRVNSFGNVRSEKRTVVAPWLTAGVPSPYAWDLLLPFLVPVLGLKLNNAGWNKNVCHTNR